jgi:hypothetical protein
MWATLALTTALNLAPAQEGGIQLKNLRLTYGVLGQVRKDASVLPGDILWLAFDIEGMTVGKDDQILYSMGTELTDKSGKAVFKEEPRDQAVVNTLGGTSIPANAHVSVGLDTPPGEYTFTITVIDRATKKSAKLDQKFEVVPLKFGLVRLAYFYPYFSPGQRDAEPAPAPPQGAAGQFYYLNFTLVGWEFSEKTKNPDVTTEVVIVDEAGKQTLSKPIQVGVKDIREEFKKLKVLPMQFPINLNRAGKFKINITATDNVTGKKVEQSLGLSVVDTK